MKAIVEMTPKECEQALTKYTEITRLVNKSGLSRDELITYTKRSGYAHYSFEGSYTDNLVALLGREPTEDEIIMLVDSGYMHFGAQCRIDKTHHRFAGRVNID